MLYTIIDISATILENILIIFAISYAAEFRYSGIKQISLLAIDVLLLSVVISIANQIEAFSFFTILVGFTFAVTSTYFFSKGNLLLRSAACIITIFFLHASEDILGFLFAWLIGDSDNLYDSFLLIIQPGFFRILYTIILQLIHFAFYILLLKILKQLRSLRTVYQISLFIIFLTAYIVLSILMQLIITESMRVIQAAVIISWLFIVICMIATLISFFLSQNYYQNKVEAQFTNATYEMMEKNYQILSINQTQLSSYTHDFTNHLRVIQDLANKDDLTALHAYLNPLLSKPYQLASLCHSGNKIVDAIINNKQVEAQEKEISYQYNIQLPENVYIESTDICAILANQLDNAIEACSLIPDKENRSIEIEIGQQGTFIFFRIINTVVSDPFINNHNLLSTKSSGLHGFGLRNIEQTAKKYDGVSKNEYKAPFFISTAMLQNKPLN